MPLNPMRLEDDKFKACPHYTAEFEACLAEQKKIYTKRTK